MGHCDSFYRTPSDAQKAPPETRAYVVTFRVDGATKPDALAVVDVNQQSSTYGQITGWQDMPYVGDELHHFGWNACSACLCPGHEDHAKERRYLVIPGIRSSRIYVCDAKVEPDCPRIHKVIEPREVHEKAGYSRLHTVHCGAGGVFVSALGTPNGDGPGGIFTLDIQEFRVQGPWEAERGDQHLHYDFWWHLRSDTMITSEWGTPQMIENGVDPNLLLNGQYGHRLHVWDLKTRRHQKTLDLGWQYQLPLELRPAHDPTRLYGFVGVVVNLEDLSSSIWMWYRENGDWHITKVIDIAAEPVEDRNVLPPLLQECSALPSYACDCFMWLSTFLNSSDK